jgi:aminoacrylate hydrolase
MVSSSLSSLRGAERQHSVDIGDALLWVEEAGAGPPIVCISGLDGRAAFWQQQIAPLATRARVIVFDQRGVGRSSRSAIRYSIAQMAEDALSILDALQCDTATLIGHGLGSAVALELALAHPERVERLVLAAPWAEVTESMRIASDLMLGLLDHDGVDDYLRFDTLRGAPSGWWDDRPGSLAEHVAARASAMAHPTIESSRLRAAVECNLRSRVALVRIPALVVAASDDQVVAAESSKRVAAQIQQMRWASLTTAGHLFPLHRAREFNALVTDFLSIEEVPI